MASSRSYQTDVNPYVQKLKEAGFTGPEIESVIEEAEQHDLISPITLDFYINPVIAEDGCTYDQESLKEGMRGTSGVVIASIESTKPDTDKLHFLELFIAYHIQLHSKRKPTQAEKLFSLAFSQVLDRYAPQSQLGQKKNFAERLLDLDIYLENLSSDDKTSKLYEEARKFNLLYKNTDYNDVVTLFEHPVITPDGTICEKYLAQRRWEESELKIKATDKLRLLEYVVAKAEFELKLQQSLQVDKETVQPEKAIQPASPQLKPTAPSYTDSVPLSKLLERIVCQFCGSRGGHGYWKCSLQSSSENQATLEKENKLYAEFIKALLAYYRSNTETVSLFDFAFEKNSLKNLVARAIDEGFIIQRGDERKAKIVLLRDRLLSYEELEAKNNQYKHFIIVLAKVLKKKEYEHQASVEIRLSDLGVLLRSKEVYSVPMELKGLYMKAVEDGLVTRKGTQGNAALVLLRAPIEAFMARPEMQGEAKLLSTPELKKEKPVCKFGYDGCRKSDCKFAHPEGRKIDKNPPPSPPLSAKELEAKSQPSIQNETKLPSTPELKEKDCKFGYGCARPHCKYHHPKGRRIDGDPSPPSTPLSAGEAVTLSSPSLSASSTAFVSSIPALSPSQSSPHLFWVPAPLPAPPVFDEEDSYKKFVTMLYEFLSMQKEKDQVEIKLTNLGVLLRQKVPGSDTELFKRLKIRGQEAGLFYEIGEQGTAALVLRRKPIEAFMAQMLGEIDGYPPPPSPIPLSAEALEAINNQYMRFIIALANLLKMKEYEYQASVGIRLSTLGVVLRSQNIYLNPREFRGLWMRAVQDGLACRVGQQGNAELVLLREPIEAFMAAQRIPVLPSRSSFPSFFYWVSRSTQYPAVHHEEREEKEKPKY